MNILYYIYNTVIFLLIYIFDFHGQKSEVYRTLCILFVHIDLLPRGLDENEITFCCVFPPMLFVRSIIGAHPSNLNCRFNIVML